MAAALARLLDAGLQLPPGEAVEWKAQGRLEGSSVDQYAAPARLALDARSSVDADARESAKRSVTYDA